jgi:hypothetical protein
MIPQQKEGRGGSDSSADISPHNFNVHLMEKTGTNKTLKKSYQIVVILKGIMEIGDPTAIPIY